MEIQRLSMVLEDSRRLFDEKFEAEKKKSEIDKASLREEYFYSRLFRLIFLRLRLEKKKSLERVKEELDQGKLAIQVNKRNFIVNFFLDSER